MLDVMLRDKYPDERFEVLDTAMTGINSHVVREIAKDCARHDGDVFILYLGNNEVTGPFGPGTGFLGYLPSLSAIRSSLWVKSTKTGQLLEKLIRGVGGEKGAAQEWQGLHHHLENRVPAYDPRLRKTYSNFRQNLSDILRVAQRSGARAIICTVPVNLKDCPPFASIHRPDLTEAEQVGWQKIHDAATTLESAGKHPEAVEHHGDWL